MCLEESIINFGITKDAVFHSCEKHTKALSDIIYPIGDKLAASKFPLIMQDLSSPHKE